MSILSSVLGWLGGLPKSLVGYRSMRVARRDGQTASQGSGDYHQKFDRTQLLPLSREYFRDNSIYRGIISRFAGYIAGGGFGLQAKTADREWNTQAERVWRRFWRRPEIKQSLSGRGVEKMIAQELLLCGDLGIIKTERGLIQIIEAEQIAGPGPSDDGIRRDKAGAPTGYNVCPYRAAGGPDTASGTLIDPKNFLFLVNPERPSSTRGIPPSQSAFAVLKRINDVCDSEAQAWQLLSRMAVSVTRKGGAELAFAESAEDDSKTPGAGDVASRMQIFDDVVIFNGEPGDEIKGIERNVPGQNFTESLTTFLRLLGLPLGLPLEFVMLDWTKSNYSQCRAILEQVSVTLTEWQELLEEFFHRPTYEWVISRAMEAGELPMNDQWDEHEWIYPTVPWIDQLKEAQAQGLQVDRGFTTHASVVKAKGCDREEVLAQLEVEVREAIRIASKISADTGVKVPWEPFAGRLPTPNFQAPQASDQVPVEEAGPAGAGRTE